MSEQIQRRILSHIKSDQYRPQRPRSLAKELNLAGEQEYNSFREALRDLMHEGRVILGARGAIVLPGDRAAHDVYIGTYRQNKRGFGFVVPSDPGSREDLYIPEGENGGAITGDIVRAKIVHREQRDGRTMYRGRITEILQRTQKKFAGTLVKEHGEWLVHPDGNTLTEAIAAP